MKKVIWSNDCEQVQSVLDNLIEEGEDNPTWETAYYRNEEALDDERVRLNIRTDSEIIIIADLGLWDGRHTGYVELRDKNIRACLEPPCDYTTFFVEDGDFRCTGIHHDGTNHYRFRERTVEDDEKWSDFLDKIYHGTVSEEDIRENTRSLVPAISATYRWEDVG